jgi:hypothetical protein
MDRNDKVDLAVLAVVTLLAILYMVAITFGIPGVIAPR